VSEQWDEPEEQEVEEDDGESAGLAGGGGPAATIFGTDDEADEHGDALDAPEGGDED
jgi:hypothetical protein